MNTRLQDMCARDADAVQRYHRVNSIFIDLLDTSVLWLW